MKYKGFSLIECLVVVAIIAVLCGILFPVFHSARAKAHQAKCASNLSQLGMAVSMYCADYDQRMVPCLSFGKKAINSADALNAAINIGGVQVGMCADWGGILFPYTKNDKKVFDCPTSLIEQGQDNTPGQQPVSTTGYAINANITGAASPKSLIMRKGKVAGVRPPLLADLKFQAKTALLADGSVMGMFGTMINGYGTNNLTYIPASYETNEQAEADGILDYAEDAVERHGKYINVLYVDGHVTNIYGTELYNELNTAISGGRSVAINGF